MKARAAAAMIWSAAAALALGALPLLGRDIAATTRPVPLDPNEGWNAAHAAAAMASQPSWGHGLYPAATSWMVNNYPPLSFYITGALGKMTGGLFGDFIFAGRALSVVAFLAICVAIAAVLRILNCGPRAIIFAVLFFAATLLIASDYVGMNDPQLLGHAVQMAGLLLVFRGRIVFAALLFAVSLFLKHNLLALPLATTVWLLVRDRHTGLRFIASGLGFCLLGLIAFRLIYGINLPAQLLSPRLSSWDNLRRALLGLSVWALAPLLLATPPLWRHRHRLFCLLYGAIALMLGVIFCAGDGVDANIFFDLAIALSLALGLTAQRGWPALSALPLLAFLAFYFPENDFFFTRDFAAQSARDIAFLKARPGPALCDQLSLCLWAGKDAAVDVFNIGEAIRSGALDPAPLARILDQRHFTALQLGDVNALGPRIGAMIERRYRIDHSDDNGDFWVPRPAP